MRIRARRRRKPGRVKILIMTIMTLLILVGLFVVYSADTNILPTMLETARLNVISKINSVAAEAVNSISYEKKLVSEDFYFKSEDASGKIQSLSVNTVLINEICMRLADEMSAELSKIGEESIKIPLGTLVGLKTFSNIGPVIKLSVLPKGVVNVDYGSEFKAAGINQVNFQVWLDISAEAQIVNPLQNTDIRVDRRIILVNTVMSGEIPDSYFNFTPQK